ncbi:MAG: GNAT family N-acetyltransferase [Actinobacteria bacterium]|nr:GNAT family N-acetyltransferase [Actinomycetota bacterium]
MVPVRQAVTVDRAGVIDTVVSAFHGDPAWEFMHGDEYARFAPLLAGVLFDLRVESGQVWVTDDLTSVALWEAPAGTSLMSTGERASVWDRYREEAGEAVWELLHRYDVAVEAVMPTEPYWYLGVLATRPECQGKGQARAVTSPVLAVADRDGINCCLETSKPSNKALYARLGFEPTADVTIEGGPPTWWLTRTPAR